MSFWSKLLKGGAAERYQKGIEYFNDGDFDKAARFLDDVITESKGRGSPIAKLSAFYAAEAHAKLGIAEFHLGNLEKALSHLEIALNENPNYPDLCYYLGVVHHQQGDNEKAIACLTKATELNSDYAEAVCFLGIALYDAGYFERATEAFGRALELSKKASNPLSRILVDKLESKSFDLPVLQELREVVIENSGFKHTIRQATAAFNRGEFAAAIEHFEQHESQFDPLQIRAAAERFAPARFFGDLEHQIRLTLQP